MSRGLRLILWVLAGVTAALSLVGARLAPDAPATSDLAIAEIYTRLASQGELLVGAYSRFQWHHPGPLPFYALVPPYVIAGQRNAGLFAGAATMSVLVLCVIGSIVARRRDALSAAVALAVGVMAWRMAEVFTSPWNPHLAILPLVGLLVVAADVVAGEATMLPWVAVLASVAAQSHVALVPTAVAVAAAPALWAAARAREGPDRGRWRRSLIVTTIILALCWCLPALEQVRGGVAGNGAELWRFFAVAGKAGQRTDVAVSAWSDMFVGLARPDLVVPRGVPFVESPVLWAEWTCLLMLALLTMDVALHWRWVPDFRPALSCLVLVASVVSLWSVSRIEERIFDHDVFWVTGLGTLAAAACGGALASAIPVKSRRVRAGVPPLIVSGWLVSMAAIAGAANDAVRAVRTPSAEAMAARRLGTELDAFCAARELVRPLIEVPEGDWGIVAGAILELQKVARPVAVPADWVVMFTPAFQPAGHEARITIVRAERQAPDARHAELISAAGPLRAYLLTGR